MNSRRATLLRLFDILWLVACAAFVALGTPYTSFHGDETTLIFVSQDFATLFLDRQPELLKVEQPTTTELQFQRIAIGSLPPYSIGLAWYFSGYSRADLPVDNFDWNLNLAGNIAERRVPPPDLLQIARIPSTVFTAFAAVAMFAFGRLIGGRPTAYAASALFILNPHVLINGRRALHEGMLLGFGIAAMLMAALILTRWQARKPGGWAWVGLAIFGGATLATKNSGILYTGAAFAAVFFAILPRVRLREQVRFLLRIGAAGLGAVAVYIALSPQLWSSPVLRIQDAVMARTTAMAGQISDDPNAPTSLSSRVTDLITMPFMRPHEHYEANYRNVIDEQADLIAFYDASILSGAKLGIVFGGALTLLAAFGLIACFVPRLRPFTGTSLSKTLLIWWGVNVIALLANPLAWARYYLPLIPPMILLAVVGGLAIFRLISPRLRAE